MSRPPLHLLDLPIEILTQILFPLTTSSPIPLCSSSSIRPSARLPARPSAILPILLTHPRLHAIATPLLYSPSQEFTLDLTSAHHAHAQRTFDDPSGTLLGSRDALRRITWLTVKLDRLRGWMGEAVVPLVADMILRGQLARLEVFLVTDTSAGQQHLRYDAARLARGSPLAGMVGLLADPYLRCARMFIQARHGKEWCRFHVDECSSEGDDGVVEVDWGRMVRELDPGGREYFPVAKATGERTGV